MTLREWLDAERVADPVSMFRRDKPKGPGRGTQEWLAARLGVDQGLVSKWVRRVTTPETYGTKIVRLSKGKVTLPELMRVPSAPAAVLGKDGQWRKR